MDEIIIRRGIGREFSITKRSENSLMPGSIYIHIKDGGNNVYLEEEEINFILKQMKKLR